MFTVAKINLIRTALGFNTSKGHNKSKGPICTAERKQSINRLEVFSRNDSVEGGKTCKRKSTNQIQTRGLSRRLREIRTGLVGAIIKSEQSCSKLLKTNSQISTSNIKMDRSMRKWQKFLKQHPSLNISSDEIEELPPNVSLEALTKETRSIRTNTTLSLPSAFKGETVPPVNPNLLCMSINPRNCKIVNKVTSLPDLFNLKFIESNYVSDPQLSAIRDLIVTQDPEIHEKITEMNRYYAQFVNEFSVKENVVWMDEKFVIPIDLQSAINNRIHAYQHGKSNMFDAAKDVWYPYIYRSIASIAEGCPECTAAGKNLKTIIKKNQLGTVPEPKEPNESVQLDFWGSINYLNEPRKYVLVAVDRFSRWPSAMVCGNNRSDKILKFLKSYITNHGVPRKIHVDQGTSFMSKEIKAFCNEVGIEIIKSPVNDHRATGCVERTIGSLKNSILTFAREKNTEPLEEMVERPLGALRFSKNSTLKISPFEAHHGREANTVLRNLTKKPSLQSLDWSRDITTKIACLDAADPNAPDMPRPADTNWSVRSDLAYDIKNRTHARRLTEDQSANNTTNRRYLKVQSPMDNRDHLDCCSSELGTET